MDKIFLERRVKLMFLVEQIQSLNDLELEVYRFIMGNRDRVSHMRIRELADESHVSTSTVLRFCKKMGYSGFTEFRVVFKQYLNTEKDAKINTDVSEIIDFLKKSSALEFEKKLDEMVQIIAKARRIIFVGSGMSGIVAKYGARYFSSIGKFSLSVDEPHYPTEGKFFENALVIICSVSGESNDTITHLNRFKEENCTILSITNSENSTIAKISDYNIAYYTTYIRIKNYDITTQIPAMSIIERIGRKLFNHGFISE
jgi:DNA-binding MurR/RpiR family transcriptional regulator